MQHDLELGPFRDARVGESFTQAFQELVSADRLESRDAQAHGGFPDRNDVEWMMVTLYLGGYSARLGQGHSSVSCGHRQTFGR